MPGRDESIFADARVLIIDDVEANVLLLRRILRNAGVTHVVGLTDPCAAVDRCREFAPDLVLLDLHMPTMDGIELMSALRAAAREDVFLPIVVLTADDRAETKKRALEAGANDFLTKPLDHIEVVLRVRNLLTTRALYMRVKHHNEVLRHNLARQHERQRRTDRLRRFKSERIRRVLDRGGLSMAYQPIVELQQNRVVGFEALARFADHPLRAPNEWFAEAAEVGLGTELELVAVELALSRFGALRPEMFMSVNVSPSVAVTDAFLEQLAPVPAHRIVVELTEHTRIDDYASSNRAFEHLRSLGMRIAVDDAGAGYAGLQHILRLRPDIVKLDQGLTGGIDADAAKRALATSMVSFAREIGAVLVAEGIETPQQLVVLRDLGVGWGQGFLLGLPGAVSVASEQPAAASFGESPRD